MLKLKDEHDIKICFIDYLQLINSKENLYSREDEKSSILSELNDIALRLSIPIVVMCQMNRQSYDAKNCKPDLSSLQQIDTSKLSTICFLHRPEYFSPIKNEQEGETFDFIVAKSHCGDTGTIPLKFFPDYLRFEQFD